MSIKNNDLSEQIIETRLNVLNYLQSDPNKILEFKVQSNVIAMYLSAQAISFEDSDKSQTDEDSNTSDKSQTDRFITQFHDLVKQIKIPLHLTINRKEEQSGEEERIRIFNDEGLDLYKKLNSDKEFTKKDEKLKRAYKFISDPSKDELLMSFKSYLDDNSFESFKKSIQKLYTLSGSKRFFRLPNLLTRLKNFPENNSHTYLLNRTYNIFFKNYNILGVLNIVKEFQVENHSLITKINKGTDSSVIYPLPEDFAKLEKLDSSSGFEYEYDKSLKSINQSIDDKLYDTLKEKEAEKYKFIQSIIREESTSFKVERQVVRANFPVGIIANDMIHTIRAVSDEILSFWNLTEVSNQPLLEFYRNTYHRLACEAEKRAEDAHKKGDEDAEKLAQLEKSHIYESIAKQVRHIMLARDYELPVSLPLFCKKGEKYYRIFRSVDYARRNKDFIVLSLDFQEFQKVEEKDFPNYLNTKIPDSQDPISGIKVSFEHSKKAYEFIFKILDGLEEQLAKTTAGEQITSLTNIVNEQISSLTEIYNKDDLRLAFEFNKDFIANKDICLSSPSFDKHFGSSNDNTNLLERINQYLEEKINEQEQETVKETYKNIWKLAKASGGTCRLPNLIFRYPYEDEDKNNAYRIEYLHSFALYYRNKSKNKLIGIAYVAADEKFLEKELDSYHRRWNSLYEFTRLASKATIVDETMTLEDILTEVEKVDDESKTYIIADALELIKGLEERIEDKIKKIYPDFSGGSKIGLLNIQEKKDQNTSTLSSDNKVEKYALRRYFQCTFKEGDKYKSKKIRVQEPES